MLLRTALVALLFLFTFSSAASAQVVALGLGFNCTAEGLENKRGRVLNADRAPKVVKRQIRKTRQKRALANRNGEPRRKIRKLSKRIKGLKFVRDNLDSCFSGVLFEDGLPTPTPTPGKPSALRDLLRQIEGDYLNGFYQFGGGEIDGEVDAIFRLEGPIFSGVITGDAVLTALLDRESLTFQFNIDGKSLPLTTTVSSNSGGIEITLGTNLDLSFFAPNTGFGGEFQQLRWTGRFTGSSFEGTIAFQSPDGRPGFSGPLHLKK